MQNPPKTIKRTCFFEMLYMHIANSVPNGGKIGYTQKHFFFSQNFAPVKVKNLSFENFLGRYVKRSFYRLSKKSEVEEYQFFSTRNYSE